MRGVVRQLLLKYKLYRISSSCICKYEQYLTKFTQELHTIITPRNICRMEDSRLVKEVVFGEIKGKTKRGRPKREWLDDVKEWCNEEIYILKWKA